MKQLLSFLVCPLCKSDLEVINNNFLCRTCQRNFQFRGEIPIFLIKEKLDFQKQKEILIFNNLKAYQELMSRPYFQDLKNKIRNILQDYNYKDKNILELGAGTSLFLDIFEKNNFIVASDINFSLLRQNQTEAHLVVTDAEYLPFRDHVFDFVYMVGLLHHLKNQRKVLEEVKRILKNDGKIFISEPTKWSLNLIYYLIRQLFLRIFGEAWLKKWIGCGTPYESFVALKDIRRVLEDDFHLRFQKILPLRLPPIKILERISLTKVNSFLEKIPVIKNLGTIIFIEAQKSNLQ